jgi:hypothetical protein
MRGQGLYADALPILGLIVDFFPYRLEPPREIAGRRN